MINDFNLFPARFCWRFRVVFLSKNEKNLQDSTFVESKLHQTDKESMIHAHDFELKQTPSFFV